jgi:drug/metabolite transporter (DMT)-like permease
VTPSAAVRSVGQTPLLIAVYATLSITLSGQWIAAKLGVTAVPALELSTMRFAIASVVLLAACAITRTPLPLHRWRLVVPAAALGVVGFNTLAFVGLTLTPASDSALIIPTMIPMATALFATLIHERLTPRKVLGFAVASAGAALVILGGQQAGSEPSTDRLRGELLEVGAAVGWAASLVVGAIVLRRETVLGYVTLMVVVGAAMLLPLGALQQAYRDVPSWSVETWLAAGFLGVFSTAVAYVLFLWAVHRFGAGLAAMVTYLTPVGTLVLAFLILSERPLLLAARRRSRDPRRRAPGDPSARSHGCY